MSAAKILFVFLIISFSLLNLFCGSKEDEEAEMETNLRQTAEIDACNLISVAEAEVILEDRIRDPQKLIISEGNPEMSSISRCNYESEDGKKSFNVFFNQSPTNDNFTSIENVRKSLIKSGKEPVIIKDIGEAAFWSFQQLHFFAGGNKYFIITIKGFENTMALIKARTVANKILENI
jgi:hypothetical protein